MDDVHLGPISPRGKGSGGTLGLLAGIWRDKESDTHRRVFVRNALGLLSSNEPLVLVGLGFSPISA